MCESYHKCIGDCRKCGYAANNCCPCVAYDRFAVELKKKSEKIEYYNGEF